MTPEQTQYVQPQNDTIDLRELFDVLKKRRKLIYLITALIAILAIIYAFLIAKPIYEIKGTVELAAINKKMITDTSTFKNKLEVIFKVNQKGKDNPYPIISKINTPKNTKGLINISAQGYDNTTTKDKIQEIINYIIVSENKELDTYRDKKTKSLELIKKDIRRQSKSIKTIQDDIKNYQNKLLNISEKDAALAGIFSIEIGQKQTELNNLSNRIYNLETKQNDIELSLSPSQIKQPKLVGELEIKNSPIKPKKKLIVIVAFITGLMLSIFLAFFLEFLSAPKKEDEQKNYK